MDKSDLYLGLVVYGGIALLALWRSFTSFYFGLKDVENIEDIKAVKVSQLIWLIISVIAFFVLNYLSIGHMDFKMVICVIGSYVALYFSVKRFICLIMAMIRSRMIKLGEQSTEQPKKGIGTDPNSHNLCAEDFQNWGHWEKEMEEEKNKKKKHLWTREW